MSRHQQTQDRQHANGSWKALGAAIEVAYKTFVTKTDQALNLAMSPEVNALLTPEEKARVRTLLNTLMTDTAKLKTEHQAIVDSYKDRPKGDMETLVLATRIQQSLEDWDYRVNTLIVLGTASDIVDIYDEVYRRNASKQTDKTGVVQA